MRKKKIFVIDDDTIFLEELESTLDSNGYEPTVCNGGSETQVLLNKSKPDLILIDLKMEQMSGFQLAKEIRRSPDFKFTPIVAMTGHFKAAEHGLLMRICGIKTCLYKPFSPARLFACLETYLNKK